MINVLLVEDKKMSQDSIIGYVNASDRYRMAATITNAGMAEMTCLRTHVDLILMDFCTEFNEDGIAAAAVIKRHLPRIKIIIVTGMTTIDLIDRARRAGADSFWYKEAGDRELLAVMDKTMAGESVYPDKPMVVQIGCARSSEFTPSEIEIIQRIANGLTDAAIAEELHISVPAVRYHVTQLFEKTGYNSRVALMADLINKDFIIPKL
jgi:DNA-binding NarL/FixJ family response regulator